jgi:hypothetical protein
MLSDVGSNEKIFKKASFMWQFFNFNSSKRVDREGPATLPPVQDASSAFANATKRRELVRTALRDLLRKNGIPVDWIGFEVVPLANNGDLDVHLVHIVVLKWHEHLMDFAPAFEEQLWRGLLRFSPEMERSELVMGWKFAPGCGCPFAALPEPEFWVTKPVVPAVVPLAPKKFDLPPSEYDHRSSGFAPTQPGNWVN